MHLIIGREKSFALALVGCYHQQVPVSSRVSIMRHARIRLNLVIIIRHNGSMTQIRHARFRKIWRTNIYNLPRVPPASIYPARGYYEYNLVNNDAFFIF